MSLRVVSYDPEAARLLGESAAWVLHARFERTAILARIPDGALVSLVRHDVPDGPFTARLERAAPRDLRSLVEPPILATSGAHVWRAQPVGAADAVDRGELAHRLGVLEAISRRAAATRAAAARAAEERPGIEAAASGTDLEALECALAMSDQAAASAVAARLAGLGPGLTPSGDDLLSGAMAFHAWAEAAGLGFAGRAAIAPPGPDALREAIRAAAVPRTTRFAAQFLNAAATGHVTAPLAALLWSLFRRAATVPPDIAPLLAIGETSGTDMLAGVRLAGRALVAAGSGACPVAAGAA